MKLPWQRLDADGFDLVTIGDDTFAFAEGYEQFAETLASAFPDERHALHQYAEMLRKMPSVEEIGGVNAYDYLSKLFGNPLLVNILSGTSLKMELRSDTLPLFTFAHSNSSYIQSSWRLRGDGNLIVDEMAKNIRQNGGDIICRAEVEELIEEDGRITAVKCANGECYTGTTFISDVHPQQTFDWLKTTKVVKKVFRRRLQMLENTFGMFTVSLLLKPETLPYFNHNKYIFRKANVWTFAEDAAGVGGVMVSARVPEDGSAFVRQIDLLTPLPWALCQPWENTTIGRRGQIYELQKERMADECIHLAECVIPGLGGMVIKRYTSTPLTWRDYTLSPCGSAFGVRKDCRQPLMTMLSPRTPVPNLLLTGQSLALHGLEGVTKTAFNTLETIKQTTI
jgi:all-trans-retinol 13,14-reductase